MTTILLYSPSINMGSGGLGNYYLLYTYFKNKNYKILFCPLLKNIESVGYYTCFNNVNIEDIKQQEIYNYYNLDSKYNLNILHEEIVTIEILKKRDNLVIYSEDIIGNPAEQKYIVRWLNFFPIEKAVLSYNFDKDYICFFSDYIYNLYDFICKKINIKNHLYKYINDPKIFRLFSFNSTLYKNYNMTRKGSCYTIRKGFPPNSLIRSIDKEQEFFIKVHSINKLNKDYYHYEFGDNLSHEQLVYLFNIKKKFISYDPFTFTSIIASLCGCISIVEPMEGLTFNEYINCDPFCKYGIAYGDNTIDHAEKTRNKLYDHINNLYKENDSNFLNFINDLQTFFNINLSQNI